MAGQRTIIACSCEDTIALDPDAIARGCRGASVTTAHQLCRAELDRFRAIAAAGGPVTVGCTQEAPLFAEVAGELSAAPQVAFANIRETAGWSADAGTAGPKIAALLAAAAEPMPPVPFVSLDSDGVILIYATHGGSGRLSGAEVHGETGYLYRVRGGKVSQVGFFSGREEALEAASLPEWSDPQNGSIAAAVTRRRFRHRR